MTGDIGAMCLYAGTSCEDIHDIPTAAEVLARLQQEMAEIPPIYWRDLAGAITRFFAPEPSLLVGPWYIWVSISRTVRARFRSRPGGEGRGRRRRLQHDV
jgi:hypothetical protein